MVIHKNKQLFNISLKHSQEPTFIHRRVYTQWIKEY